MDKPEHDFEVHYEGNIFLFKPMSAIAQEWCDERFPKDARRQGTEYVIEHMSIEEIIQDAVVDGYDVHLVRQDGTRTSVESLR